VGKRGIIPMSSIQDDRGYNQGYKPSRSLDVRNQRRCCYILDRMELNAETKILEIGCGTGELSHMMAQKTDCKILGIDICAPFIEQARKNFNLSNLEFKTLDFNDADNLRKITAEYKFDYVIGNGILHHLYYNLDESLSNIHSLLKKGGGIIFLEPNFYNPYCLLIFNIKLFRKLARLEPDEMTFTGKIITRKLEKAFFSDIKVEYRDFLVPGTPEFLIKPVITIGGMIEKIPVLNMTAQSIYIFARKERLSD
jgi:2-polyprenyl-3-methyl-5-hydroxy-6-metoxy-1,4-benzoquinol methylase